MNFSRRTFKEIANFRNINPVIRTLIISDIIIFSGFGLLGPVFAIYITDQVQAGIESVGMAATIYLIVKSLGQLVVAEMIDRIKGERDDFWCMVLGSLTVSLVPLLYIAVSTPMQLYAVQFFYGLAVALTFPSWMAIFTRHVDHQKEGLEWGLYFTSIDFIGAGAATVGSVIVASFGFNTLFVVVSIFSALGSSYMLWLRRYFLGKNRKKIALNIRTSRARV